MVFRILAIKQMCGSELFVMPLGVKYPRPCWHFANLPNDWTEGVSKPGQTDGLEGVWTIQ